MIDPTGNRGPKDLHELAQLMLDMAKEVMPAGEDDIMLPQVMLRLPDGRIGVVMVPPAMVKMLFRTGRGKDLFFASLDEMARAQGATAIVTALETRVGMAKMPSPAIARETLHDNRMSLDELKEAGHIPEIREALVITAQGAAGAVMLMQCFERKNGEVIYLDRHEDFHAHDEYAGRIKMMESQPDIQ